MPDLRSPANITQSSLYAIAAALARDVFASDPGESESRLNTLNGLVGHLPREQRTPLLRRLAEAWQLLEMTGSVCHDPEQPQGDWWFLTQAGRALLTASAPVDTLRLALGR